MKPLMSSACMICVLILASCDIYVAEPRYDYRDQITGYFNAEEYSNTYHDYTYYSISVSKSTYSSNEIKLHNFYGANITVYAYINGTRITIPEQVINGYKVEGTGYLQGTDLHFNYSVKDLYDNTYTDFCDTMARRN
jgi:hypothetical protein